MSDLSQLTEHLGALLQKIEPRERRKLSTKIGQKLRKQQQLRISKQQNPNGSRYVPRKNKLRLKKGRIKQQMFLKIKNAKYLRLQNDASRIAIGFAGRIANTARVHQFGLKDSPNRNGRYVKYAQRELLGFTGDEIDFVEDEILNYLSLAL